ncbi:MAG: VRR-NUC domain-containing protein [Trueperaceae bacterium]|nr:VRR-NUC domain-containing protein [Trueperaceae bacterium]
MGPRPVRARGPRIPESAFQAQFLTYASMNGWRSFHARPAQNRRGEWGTAVAGDGKGFPDTVLLRDERIVVAELKAEGGTLRPDQRAWIAAWRLTPAEVYVWTPEDWSVIFKVLSRVTRRG